MSKFSPLGRRPISDLLACIVPMPIKSWWQKQSRRDQNALSLLGWLCVFVLFYTFLWLPVLQKNTDQIERSAKQAQRQEQALLRYYDQLNQYGSTDFSPFDSWLKAHISHYQLSLIYQQKANKPASGKLSIRYQQQALASEFLIAADKRIAITGLQVDQVKREISFHYDERF